MTFPVTSAWQFNPWPLAGWQLQGKGKGKAEVNPQSRVLLVTFKDTSFPGHDAIQSHFSKVATVEKITHVSKPDREQALVQVSTVDEALACIRTLQLLKVPFWFFWGLGDEGQP